MDADTVRNGILPEIFICLPFTDWYGSPILWRFITQLECCHSKRQYASLVVGDCSKDCKGCKKTPFNEEDSALFDVKDSSKP